MAVVRGCAVEIHSLTAGRCNRKERDVIVSLPEYRIVTEADSVELVRYPIDQYEAIYKVNIFHRNIPPWVLTDSFTEEQVDMAFDVIARAVASAQKINGIVELHVGEMKKAMGME
jgi:hypothetical protein